MQIHNFLRHRGNRVKTSGREAWGKADQFVCYLKFTSCNDIQFFFSSFSSFRYYYISVPFYVFLFAVPFVRLNHHSPGRSLKLSTPFQLNRAVMVNRPTILTNFADIRVPVSKKITKNVPQ